MSTNESIWTGSGSDWTGSSGAPPPGVLLSANNLSDVASASAARTNLGLGSAAVDGRNSFCRNFTGSLIDCFAPAGTTWVLVPAQGSGLYMDRITDSYIITTQSGTLTTSPIFKVGTNGAHDNYATAYTIAAFATINASGAVGRRGLFSGPTVFGGTYSNAPDLSSDLVIEMVTPAAGAGAAFVIRPHMQLAVVAYP